MPRTTRVRTTRVSKKVARPARRKESGPPPSERATARLARFRTPQGVLSLYLSFAPSGGERRDLHAALRDALALVDEEPLDKKQRARLAEERQRVEGVFRRGFDLHGRSLIAFSCAPRDLWEVYQLQVPVRTLARFADRPAVAPLAALLDRYERYGVVLVDKDRARLLQVYLGRVEDRVELVDKYPGRTEMGGWAQSRYQHHRDAHLHAHLLRAVERLLAEARRHATDRLLVGGPDEARSAFLAVLPQSLRARVAGTFAAESFLSDVDVVERVRAIEEEAQRAAEARLVTDVLDTAHAGGAAAIGWDETLQALAEGRVYKLALADGETASGWVCPAGHFASIEKLAACPQCGAKLKRTADLQEWAAERALDTDAAIESVQGEAAAALATGGAIGALLRY